MSTEASRADLRSRRQRLILVPVAAALVLACSSTDPRTERDPASRSVLQNIAEGGPASEEDFVFFVEITLGSGTALCSASALTPHLLLTAGHCLTGQFEAVDCETTRFNAPLAPSQFRVTNAPDLSGAPDPAWHFQKPTAVSVIHEGQLLCGQDLGLLVFKEPLSGVSRFPPVLPPLSTHESYRALGYGAGHSSGTGERLRRTSGELKVGCREEECAEEMLPGIAGAPSAPAPALTRGEFLGPAAGCPGDSGGPAATVLEEDWGVFAVLSRGTEDCSINIYSDAHTPALRAQVRTLSQGLGAPIPDWAQEVEAPTTTPDPSEGGSSGSPAAEGGAAGAVPDDEEIQVWTSDDDNCSCRTAGRKASSSSALRLFFLALLLFTARWRRTRRGSRS